MGQGLPLWIVVPVISTGLYMLMELKFASKMRIWVLGSNQNISVCLFVCTSTCIVVLIKVKFSHIFSWVFCQLRWNLNKLQVAHQVVKANFPGKSHKATSKPRMKYATGIFLYQVKTPPLLQYTGQSRGKLLGLHHGNINNQTFDLTVKTPFCWSGSFGKLETWLF